MKTKDKCPLCHNSKKNCRCPSNIRHEEIAKALENKGYRKGFREGFREAIKSLQKTWREELK